MSAEKISMICDVNYSPTCVKQAAKGNTKSACIRQVLA